MVAGMDLEAQGRCLAKDGAQKEGGGQDRQKTSVRFRLWWALPQWVERSPPPPPAPPRQPQDFLASGGSSPSGPRGNVRLRIPPGVGEVQSHHSGSSSRMGHTKGCSCLKEHDSNCEVHSQVELSVISHRLEVTKKHNGSTVKDVDCFVTNPYKQFQHNAWNILQ